MKKILYILLGAILMIGTTAYAAPSVFKIIQGGTFASSQTTNGINYYDSTRITSNANLNYNGTTVGIGTTTPNANVALAVSGGCAGCIDLVLNQGINLLKAKYFVATTTSGTAANTYTDIYTAPAGRRALFTGGNFSNGTAGAINESVWLHSGGSYYQLLATSSFSSHATNTSGAPGYVLEPGEALAVFTDTAGLSFYQSGIEFSNASTFRSVALKALSSTFSTTTVYTVPTGHSAQLSNFTPGMPTVSSIGFGNASPNTVKDWCYLVPSGGVATGPNTNYDNAINQNGTSILTGAMGGINFNAVMGMSAGDSIQCAVDTSLAGTGSMFWVTVNEI